MKSVLFFGLLAGFLGCPLKAGETNEFFLTDDGFLSDNHAQKVEAAKKSRESLPAEKFPEGNWGAPTNGFQLSLRFDKATYAPGEPIVATMLLRNVTNIYVEYVVAGTGLDGPIGFVVSDAAGVVAPIPLQGLVLTAVRAIGLVPGTQNKYVERLDKTFDLKKPGRYSVYARYGIGSGKYVELRSAAVTIEIKE